MIKYCLTNKFVIGKALCRGFFAEGLQLLNLSGKKMSLNYLVRDGMKDGASLYCLTTTTSNVDARFMHAKLMERGHALLKMPR